MAFDVQNKKYVFVGANIARSTTTTVSGIADGEVVLAEPNGNTLQGSTGGSGAWTGKLIQVVEKYAVNNSSKYRKSPVLKYANITNYNVKGYVADQQFVSVLGYDAAAAPLYSLEAPVANTTYSVKIRREHVISGEYDKWFNNKTTSWTAPSNLVAYGTGVQMAMFAQGLFEELVSNYYNSIDYYILPALHSTAAGTVSAGTFTTAVFTQYSTQVVLNGTTTNMLAGTQIRVGHEDTSTYPIYGVKSYNSTTHVITLTTPFLGATATVAKAAIGVITVDNTVAGTTDLWGISLTGNTHFFQVGRFAYDLFNATIWLRGFASGTSTPVTLKTKAVKGVGVYDEVAQAEWYAYESGTNQFFENDMPPRTTPLNASSSVTYNLTSISGYGETSMFVNGKRQDYWTILIATPTNGFNSGEQGNYNTGNTKPVGIATGLDQWVKDNNGGTDPNQDANLA